MSVQDKITKKVSIAILAGSREENYSFTPAAVNFDFIYGIFPAGLTPFEVALGDMNKGQSAKLLLTSQELGTFFGPLLQPVRQVVGLHILPEKLSLLVELMACTEASPREVVQSMAKSLSNGGCGGSCDCGCE